MHIGGWLTCCLVLAVVLVTGVVGWIVLVWLAIEALHFIGIL